MIFSSDYADGMKMGASNLQPHAATWRLGPLIIEPSANRVTHPDRQVILKRGEIDLLVFLLEAAPAVVTSSELLDALWPGRVVEEGTIHRRISKLRSALGDDARAPRFIETIPKRGYRILAAVEREGTDSNFGQGASNDFPLVGRTSELGLLTQRLAAVVAGEGQVALLAGEAGIGKTRLAEELIKTGQGAGAVILRGWCNESGDTMPYRPWINILRALKDSRITQAVDDAFDASRPVLQLIAPELYPDAESSPPRYNSDAEATRRAIVSAIATPMKAVVATHPLLLVIDDLHRADEATLVTLNAFIRVLGHARVMLLGTYRPSEVQPRQPLIRTLADLGRHHNFTRLELSRLSREDIAALLRGSLAQQAAMDDADFDRTNDAIYERSEGNPLFATMLIRHGDSTIADSGNIALRELVLGQLGDLTREEFETLETAAVMGRSFSASLLETFTSSQPTELEQFLKAMQKAGITRQTLHEEWQFSHLLVRDVLYQEIAPLKRQALHRAVAEASADWSGRKLDIESAVQIAHHYTLADAPIEAARWYQRAFVRANGVDHFEAYRCCRRGLEVLESSRRHAAGNESRDNWIQRLSVNALLAAGPIRAARTEVDVMYRHAVSVTVNADDQLGILLTTSYSDYFAFLGEPTRALRYAKEAHAQAAEATEAVRLHAVITYLARLKQLGQDEVAFAVAETALQTPPANPLTSIADSSTWFPWPRVIVFYAMYQALRGAPHDALANVLRALAILREDQSPVLPTDINLPADQTAFHGDPAHLHQCLSAAITVYYVLGDADNASRCATELVRSIKMGSPAFWPDTILVEALAAHASSNWEQLLALGEEAKCLATEHPGIPLARAMAIEAQLQNQRSADAEKQLESLLSDSSRASSVDLILSLVRSLLRLDPRGKQQQICELLTQAQKNIDASRAISYQPMLLELVAQHAGSLGEAKRQHAALTEARSRWVKMGATKQVKRLDGAYRLRS